MDKKIMRRKIIFSLIIIVTLVSILSTITFGWFVWGDHPKVENSEYFTTTAVGFKASTDNRVYTNIIELNLPNSVEFEPISGNGVDFYKANIPLGSNDPATAGTVWETLPDYSENNRSNSFYKTRVYIKADKPGFVALTEAKVSPADAGLRKVSNTLAYQITDASKVLSRDYIACAGRISLTNYSESGTQLSKYLVIPMDNYKLNMTNVGTETNPLYDFVMDKTNIVSVDDINSDYEYYNGSYITKYNTMSSIILTQSLVESTTIYVGELIQGVSDPANYYSIFDIAVWIEGFDDEAIDLFAGGQITVQIKFEYYETKET